MDRSSLLAADAQRNGRPLPPQHRTFTIRTIRTTSRIRTIRTSTVSTFGTDGPVSTVSAFGPVNTGTVRRVARHHERIRGVRIDERSRPDARLADERGEPCCERRKRFGRWECAVEQRKLQTRLSS